MRKYRTIFHLISSILTHQNASCVLIGGFAVNYYKVARHTQDVDFLTTRNDFEKIRPLFEKEGFGTQSINKVFAQLKANKWYLLGIDFMFVDHHVLEKIIKEGREITIARQKFTVPSLLHLIALKLHSIKYNKKREYKDLLDIIELIKANNIKTLDSEFRELCLTYGTHELYDKIKTACN